jgi:hypothetical protein
MKLVVSQPMFLPWLGLFEQIRLCDVYVHYDDVQLPQGRSFTTRVQVKTSAGTQWLTAPVDRVLSGRLINETYFKDESHWLGTHLKTLRHSYGRCSYAAEMLGIADQIYSTDERNVASFNIGAINAIADYLGVARRTTRSSELNVGGHSTQRLVDICKRLGATTYITGHGAKAYLDHRLFDDCGIDVQYMNYQLLPYAQPNGPFTPYVTALDAIANCGVNAVELMQSSTISWREFVDGSG